MILKYYISNFHGFISPILVFELVGPLSTNARTSDIIQLKGNLQKNSALRFNQVRTHNTSVDNLTLLFQKRCNLKKPLCTLTDSFIARGPDFK